MKTLVRVAMVTALLAGGLSLTGCAKSAPDPAKLKGDWKLESFGGTKDLVAADPSVTTDAEFGGTIIGGGGGVNRYSGPYTAGTDGSLTFGTLAATKMMGPEAAMAQEDKFFAALDKTKHFEFDEGKLVLSDAANNTLAVLVPK